MTATIDYRDRRFYVEVHDGGRRIEYRVGSYLEVVTFATRAGVPRSEVSLTPAAQSAAMALCWGGGR